MTLRKGENVPLRTTDVQVEFRRRQEPGTPRTDVCALLLVDGSARGPDDLVGPGAPRHPAGAVRCQAGAEVGGTAVDTVALDLAGLPAEVTSVVVFARGDGGAFRDVPAMRVRVTGADGAELARYDCGQAGAETAYVLGECYRRAGGWRFRAVGQGYASGTGGLAAAYGLAPGELPELPAAAPPSAAPPAAPAPPRAATSAPARPVPATAVPATRVSEWHGAAASPPAKVTLTKQAPAVSLTKQGGTSGALRVSLDWQAPQGRWARSSAVDLDLCALFELSDGSKGVVQALGGAFGSLGQPPFILLDGDDRAGGAGENLTLNLDRVASFRRVLLFVTIYQGARSFAGLHASVTLRPQHGAPVDFTLDECTVDSNVCALALLVREGQDLVVRREARYLVPRRGVSPQRTVDYAYGWGLAWTPGRK
ncbi:TerD family protein [Streptomyces sp. V4-01]|uniref:TerD family protein n=1 Tax=Actinacidiphila polyblastidii TaxID=3110430 RepID=A0ABU7PGL2_9ACTN|nr:TerD family protein [Streptomyces sp. V4-01]